DARCACGPPAVGAAVVAADGSLEALHAGAGKALAALEKAPGGAAIAAMIRQQTTTKRGDVLDRRVLDDLGFDLGKGAAVFKTKSAMLVILPVNAGKLVAKVKPTKEGDAHRLGPLLC